MEGILLILLVLFVICFAGKFVRSGGGCNVKPKTNSKKPEIYPAPQAKIK